LRLRVVLITVLGVTAVVAAGGFLIIRDVRGDFLDAADWLAEARAAEVSEELSAHDLPRELPEQEEGESFVWIVRDHSLVSASVGLPDGRPPVALPLQAVGEDNTFASVRLRGIDDQGYRVTALGTSGADGPATVYVAVRVDEIEEFVETAVRTGATGLLLLILPLGLVLWWAVGRTLAPVEAIRERAATITERHLSEGVPEPARQDEIGRLARTINEMLRRLDVAARDQRRFLADAAHELRSPIASIRTQLEAAPPGTHGGALSREDLLAETLRMQVLVDQFLTLARSEDATFFRARTAVDLDDVVIGVVTTYRWEHPDSKIVVDTTGVHPVQVQGDPGLLQQVVRNLVDNAAGYARTTVWVSLEREHPDAALLTVDDDGPGIPPEFREEVFKRFARVDPARDRTNGGAGLGLAIVSDIVTTHGGTVVAEESPAGGARLRVRLPIRPAPGESQSL
jgi:signal transduction histidine kinase